MLQKWADEHRQLSIGLAAIATLLIAMLFWCVYGFFTSLMWPEQIVYHNLAGTIRYQDDSLIPVHSMSIELSPLRASNEEIGYHRPAFLLVDCSSGFFSGVIQTLGQSTQQAHMYRVVVRNAEGSQISPDLIPERFTKASTSTLCIDVREKNVVIQIPKPRKQRLAEFAGTKLP